MILGIILLLGVIDYIGIDIYLLYSIWVYCYLLALFLCFRPVFLLGLGKMWIFLLELAGKGKLIGNFQELCLILK